MKERYNIMFSNQQSKLMCLIFQLIIKEIIFNRYKFNLLCRSFGQRKVELNLWELILKRK